MSERRGARRRSRDLFVASPSVADIAAVELEASDGPAPGLLWCSGARDEPVFARQVLAGAVELSGSSPDELSLAVFQWLDASTAEAMLRGEVIVHVSWPEFGEGSRRRHAPYMAEAATILEAIEARRAGRARKKDVVRSDEPATSLLQVLVTGRWRAFVSCGKAPASDPLLAWPSLFPAGRAPVSDRPAPSSAFRKLVEAFAWLGTQPNEDDRVLDLGAAPGGWTWVCAELGARVIAYDRAVLDPALMRNPLVEHRREDAFADPPMNAATWMLCDVIDEPERAAWLVNQAAKSETVRALVVTLKLKRPVKIRRVRDIIAQLPHDTLTLRVKHLVHNKSEVTILGRRGPHSSTHTSACS